jgi:uncharacterized cupin superfamily protein
MARVTLARSSDRDGWSSLVDPPGERGSRGAEREFFRCEGFAAGFWEREPDTWSFERPHDEVSFIVAGSAEIEVPSGSVHPIGPGDVLVTPRGSKGTWRISETLVKFWATYDTDDAADPDIHVVRATDPLAWSEIPTADDDPTPPGEETVEYRSADGRYVAGFWRRAPETGPMEVAYDELAILIEGDVDVDGGEGDAVSAGPGDVIVTPNGFAGTWRAHGPVRKFWVLHKHPEGNAT